MNSSFFTPPTRRDFLYGLGASLGSVAFSDILAKENLGCPTTVL